MLLPIILTLILGIIVGMENIMPEIIIKKAPTVILFLLIFVVGIDIGSSRGVLKGVKRYGIKILLIPLLVALGSIVFGLCAGYLMGMKPNHAMAVASGFGWYSLSGILISNLANIELGTLAFLTNIAREVFSFLLIPVVSKRGRFIAVAPGGATSMDSTLPFIVKYAGAEIAIVGVISGVILSALVPILVPFFLALH